MENCQLIIDECGDHECKFTIGNRYHKGLGVEYNIEVAIAFYKLVTERRHALELCSRAQYILGTMYHTGIFLPYDIDKAMKLYQSSVDKGNDDAARRIKEIEYHGHTYDKEAIYLSCYNNIVDSSLDEQYDIALHVFYEGERYQQDKFLAARIYKRIADQGHSDAQYKLGKMFDNGDSVLENKHEAIKLYKLSADQGNDDAKIRIRELINE
jgi:TPR repeat protein